jgi:hypothetical protein
MPFENVRHEPLVKCLNLVYGPWRYGLVLLLLADVLSLVLINPVLLIDFLFNIDHHLPILVQRFEHIGVSVEIFLVFGERNL